MSEITDFDAVVVGSGPNGLAAAITLAQTGLSVILFEAKETVGGGMRSEQITLPGFIHDICSAVHPLAVSSPFFKTLPLQKYGLTWIVPSASLAHPFENGEVVLLKKSISETATYLNEDRDAYLHLMESFVANWDALEPELLAPLHFPRHPLKMAKFGYCGIHSSLSFTKRYFSSQKARTLFAGLSAHSMLPLKMSMTSAFGLLLGILGHSVGWAIPCGGSQKIADALESYFLDLGGQVVTGFPVNNIEVLPPTKAVLLDLTPKQLLHIAGHRFPSWYRRQLEKYRYGPGVFKLDWALDGSVPFKNKDCLQAGTIHLGASLAEISHSEREVWRGNIPKHPFVILAQPSLFDSTRAPAGKHTAWAYCHVPNGSTTDMKLAIENHVERFAPGFRDRILATHAMSPVALEQYNSNYIGGDINGGIQDWRQMFTRPAVRWNPYSTPLKNVYICSSATPPGGGVHGMCGYHAAQTALKKTFRH